MQWASNWESNSVEGRAPSSIARQNNVASAPLTQHSQDSLLILGTQIFFGHENCISAVEDKFPEQTAELCMLYQICQGQSSGLTA